MKRKGLIAGIAKAFGANGSDTLRESVVTSYQFMVRAGAVRTSVTLLVQNMGNTLLLIVYTPWAEKSRGQRAEDPPPHKATARQAEVGGRRTGKELKAEFPTLKSSI
jgi:hypothetical protein